MSDKVDEADAGCEAAKSLPKEGKDVVSAVESAVPQTPPREIPVRDPVAKILIRICEGWEPKEIVQPLPVKQLVWGERDISRVARELTLDGPWIDLLCGGEGSSRIDPELSLIAGNSLWNQALKGTLDNGSQFSAAFGVCNNRNMRLPTDGPSHYSVSIRGEQWLIKGERRAPDHLGWQARGESQ